MDRYELMNTDMTLPAETEAFRSSVASLLAKESTGTQVRAAEPLGFSKDLWTAVCSLGVVEMAVASGDAAAAPLSDLVVISEEFGITAAPVPMVSHVAATRLLAQTALEPHLVDEALTGRRVLTVAHQRSGHVQLLPDGAIADGVVALEGADLVLITSETQPSHVPTHGSTPAALWEPSPQDRRIVLASGADAARLHARAVLEWKLLTAGALVGLTQTALDLAVNFARTRTTRGATIGSLQGISFQLADVETAVQGARHLARRAAWEVENGDETSTAITSAFPVACRTATAGTQIAAHVHGGLGFSSEADVSLYFLRAKGWSVLGGDPSADYLAVADALVSQLS